MPSPATLSVVVSPPSDLEAAITLARDPAHLGVVAEYLLTHRAEVAAFMQRVDPETTIHVVNALLDSIQKIRDSITGCFV